MSFYFGYVVCLLVISGIDYIYVRMVMYMDLFKLYLLELMNMYKLIYLVGDGCINYIIRNDIVRGVIVIIKNLDIWGKCYLLLGYSYDMKEFVVILFEVLGIEIKYEFVLLEIFVEMYDEFKGFGVLLVLMYDVGVRGLLD